MLQFSQTFCNKSFLKNPFFTLPVLCKLHHKLLLEREVAQNLAAEILAVENLVVRDNQVECDNLVGEDNQVEGDIQVEGGNLVTELSMGFLTMIYGSLNIHEWQCKGIFVVIYLHCTQQPNLQIKCSIRVS